MDVEFRRDVNAARRLVEQQNPRGAGNRAREHRFLLIAAAQPPDVLARPRRPEANAAAKARVLARSAGRFEEDAETGEPAEMRQSDVERYVMRQKKPLRPALARHIGKTAAPRIGGIADARGAARRSRSRRVRAPPIETFQQTIAARVADARDSEDLALAKLEGEIVKDRGQPRPEPTERRRAGEDVAEARSPPAPRARSCVRSGAPWWRLRPRIVASRHTVAQHGDAVGDPQHLVDAVRDIDDCRNPGV